MPRANWLTPVGGNSYQEEPEPKGLLGFLGAGPDFGADVGDRLGVISQILMNLGSGRGGAGIAEATAAVNSRSEARRERRKEERMVARAADKIEPSNPELAAAMRVNTKFGLQMLGRQMIMPLEFEQEQKLTNMREEAAYRRALDLQNAKAAAEDKRRRLTAEMWGLSVPSDPASQSTTGDIPVDAIVPNDPNSTSLGTGADEIIVSPISEQSTIEPAVPDEEPAAAQDGIDWTVGLPDNPVQAKALVNLRKRWGDPDMPGEDMFQLSKAAMNDDNVGFDAFKQAVAARKETRRRATEFATRSNEVARQNQPLPGINLQQPGQPELMQANIDPATIPPPQQAQAGEYLKQAYKTGDKDYTAALKDLMPSDSAGLTITTQNADGSTTTVTTGKGGTPKGPTEQMRKWDALYTRAMSTNDLLDDPAVARAYSSFWQQRRGEVPYIGNFLTSKDYKAGKIAADNFLTAILRQESMATITTHEEESYTALFLPQPGDDEATVAIRQRLRAAALEGLKSGGSTPMEAKADAAAAFATAKKTLEAEIGPQAVANAIPPYSEKARKAGITEEEWRNNSDPRAWAKFSD